MKLIIHASLFASGTIEVDTVTGKTRFMCSPVIKDDQALFTSLPPESAMKAGNCALAALHMAIAEAIVGKVMSEPKEPVPLVNVVGKGSA